MIKTRESYVARQPILDKQHRIVGYELLFRSAKNPEDATILDADHATVEVMVDSFSAFRSDEIMGDTLAFINVTPALVMDDLLEVVANRQVVLELPKMKIVHPDFKRRCRELAKRGIQFSLQDFTRRDSRAVLLDVAKYVKIDPHSIRRSELKQLVRKVKRTNTKIVAERVEGPQDLQICRQVGCDLFQGYYFLRPATVLGKRVDPERAVLMDLLMKLGQACEFDELVDIFKRNPSLSVNLLRLVNSGSLARATKINSVPEAIVLIGSRQLSRWVTLLLYADAEDGGMEEALMKMAAKRGRVLELLYKELPAAGDTSPEVAFLVGMLSLLDSLFGIPMDEVLGQVAVDEEVRECILHRTGPLGALLNLEEKIESSDFRAVDVLLEELGISVESFASAHHEAYSWVHANEAPQMTS